MVIKLGLKMPLSTMCSYEQRYYRRGGKCKGKLKSLKKRVKKKGGFSAQHYCYLGPVNSLLGAGHECPAHSW